MGLLTDPKAGNGEIAKFILKAEKPLCFILYFAGIIWMMLLAIPYFNDNTYYSENALLPGLVKKESNLLTASKQFYNELNLESSSHEMPLAWIITKFHQLNLEAYVHNFTLNYPFHNIKYQGQNVYGIIRASRAFSTEAIVISVPYRSKSDIYADTTPSVALLLAFAEFCRKQKYWAKDIIFLITEYEQLGMQAWLNAYHSITKCSSGILDSGDLLGRGGSIQAAINLELHSMTITSVDVKIEGLNGQLPNLDLFNLAQNMINKEGIRRSFQGRFDTFEKNRLKQWWYHFNTLMLMILTQATGVPTGNHGLFHRFGIEAISLEGFNNNKDMAHRNLYHVGRVVESVVRSMNNLLERFHQSFFFYLLSCTDRFISIALYTISLALIVAGLLIKAFSLWLQLQESTININNVTSVTKIKNNKHTVSKFNVGNIASTILWIHSAGAILMLCPRFISIMISYFQLQTENAIYTTFLAITVTSILCPLIYKSKGPKCNSSLLCIITCVELATILMSLAMYNFSFALLSSVLYVPVVLCINPDQINISRYRKILCIVWPMLHPFFISTFIILIYTYFQYRDEVIWTILNRSFKATKNVFVLSVVDSLIYGNLTYNVSVAVALPIWLLYWIVINRPVDL